MTSTATLVLTLVAAWFAAGCGVADDGSGDGPTSSTNPTIACDGIGATSSAVDGHTHEVCVPSRDLTSPPASGATYTTTTDDGHTHRVTLDAAQLSAIGRGELARVTTTLDDGHVHTYSLARTGTLSPPPRPGGSGSGGSSGGPY